MKLLLTHNGTDTADNAIRDFHRAGLPEKGKALLLWCEQGVSRQGQSAADPEVVVEQIRALLPGWEICIEKAAQASVETVLHTASWWAPDLLILGCPRTPETAADNIAFEVAHRARCSVRMVTPQSIRSRGPIRLLVADDGSAGAQAALRMVALRSWPADTEIRMVAVGPEAKPGSPEPFHRLGLDVTQMKIDGDPGRALVAEADAWKSDAVFLGAHGASGANRFLLGSVSTAVITRLRRTVEVVR